MTNSLSKEALACLRAIAVEWIENGQPSDAGHDGYPHTRKALDELLGAGLLLRRTTEQVALTKDGKAWARANAR